MGVLGVIKDVAMFVLVLYCCSIIHGVGTQWWNTFTDLDVYTISDPNFWGPVTMLIPNNCTEYDQLQIKKKGQQPPAQLSSKKAGVQYPTVEMSWLGHPVLPQGVSRHDIVNLVQLTKCGRNVSTDDISTFQWWGAAVSTAQSSYATIDGLHSSRFRFWWLFVAAFVLGQMVEVMQSCAKAAGDPDAKIPMAAFVVQFMIKKFSNWQSQLQICSLFITFWDEDHYVMSYMPGMGYILMYLGGIAIAVCASLLPEPINIGVGGCCGCLWGFFVLIPMLTVYPFYLMNFLYMAFVDTGDLKKYQLMVHAAWPSMTKMAGHTSKALFGFNIVDFALTFVFECAQLREPKGIKGEYEDAFVRIEDAEVPTLEKTCAQPTVVHPK